MRRPNGFFDGLYSVGQSAVPISMMIMGAICRATTTTLRPQKSIWILAGRIFRMVREERIQGNPFRAVSVITSHVSFFVAEVIVRVP